ncbi:MAG TPA: peptidoglycan editing factor PgeF [Terracidiphilus sp.]|nr:peptidoglycan editing factor PgeF [Terracidiphilus sp.]
MRRPKSSSKKRAGGELRPTSGARPDAELDAELDATDALLEAAGLVRRRRGAAGITQRMRMERAEPQELAVRAAEPETAANGVRWLAVPGWGLTGPKKLSWLWHGFSTRQGGLSRVYCAEDAPGELNLGFTEADEREIVETNRRLFVEAVTGDGRTPLVTLRQFHSNLVVRVGREDAARAVPRKADGAMTDEPGVLVAVQTADCLPVLVADRKQRAVAAFHAGWRGTVKRIVELGVGRMRAEFGSKPEDLTAAIGPGVGACCYAVGEEVLSAFESQFAYGRELFREVYDADPVRTKYPMLFLTQRAPGHSPIGPGLHVDLTEANRRQLLDAGLKPEAIRATGGCTMCQQELFFSHRASKGHAGRMLSGIGIRPR